MQNPEAIRRPDLADERASPTATHTRQGRMSDSRAPARLAISVAIAEAEETSVGLGILRRWPQHSEARKGPQADHCQPDDQAQPPRKPGARRHKPRGQRRVSVPAESRPASQADEITTQSPERKSEGYDHNDPLRLAQPLNQAFRPNLPDSPRRR